MTWVVFAQFIDSTLRASTPIILVAIGAVFSHRAGIFNLGLEGFMLFGAFGSIAGTIASGSQLVGLALAIALAMIASLLFWVVTEVMKADPIIAGLGISILGLGGTSFALQAIFHSRGAIYVNEGLWRPVRNANGGILAMVSDLSILVWVTPVLVFIVWLVLRRTRFGITVSVVGDYPFAARSAGIVPSKIKLQAMLITGAFAGLGGAELALGSLRAFTENITQGRGFMAFTAVVFGAGAPIGAALAGLFFGLADAVGIQTQVLAEGLPIPREVILALPYFLTIAAVWFDGNRRKKRGEQITGFGEFRNE